MRDVAASDRKKDCDHERTGQKATIVIGPDGAADYLRRMDIAIPDVLLAIEAGEIAAGNKTSHHPVIAAGMSRWMDTVGVLRGQLARGSWVSSDPATARCPGTATCPTGFRRSAPPSRPASPTIRVGRALAQGHRNSRSRKLNHSIDHGRDAPPPGAGSRHSCTTRR